ncbi:hypothetical protein FHU10_5083 [Serratia fonticola]|uniref:Lipoprotein n=1 Tax=Serratia fonticola TaxID=47917 RepID=A0A542BNF4_SERFO|nr:hypothetical protein [Serratia fonticola]TQI80065.1 hypothetical protein FHU09_2622 [Serratia fonticola]TVZ72405.1 hypothetical protein FHU10_5083 [Serratia fonticola]
MIKITQLKSSVLVLLLLTVFSCHATRSEKMDSTIFWQFVNNIKTQLPKGLSYVTHIFNNPFVVQAENDVFTSYENKEFLLDGKVNIENIEARVFRKNNKVPYLLTFQVHGACITLAELKQHYTDLTITDIPRGRSLDEETTYSTPRYDNRVKLAFGFAEKNPNCLRSVVFSIDES